MVCAHGNYFFTYFFRQIFQYEPNKTRLKRNQYCTLPLAFKTTKFARILFFDRDSKISIADLRVTRKIWSDNQCKPTMVGPVKSNSVCWDTCKKITECNAVNYNLDNRQCAPSLCKPSPSSCMVIFTIHRNLCTSFW